MTYKGILWLLEAAEDFVMRVIPLVVVALLVLFAFAYVTFKGKEIVDGRTIDEAEISALQYCWAVELYFDTNGELGWPDFNKNYDEVCADMLNIDRSSTRPD